MANLLDRLKKSSRIEGAASLGKTKAFSIREMAPTKSLSVNIAHEGDINGGLKPGLLMIAGPSKHFKSNLGLLNAAAWMEKYPESVMLFYDSEFGSKPAYFASFGIDPERVLHLPIKNVEELKFDLVNQLDNMGKEDNVIIFIDSIGNLASKKEVQDALSENTAADMTRAKQLKSLWRMVTPYFALKGIPCIAINHTYESMAMYGGPTVSGGCVIKGTRIITETGLKNIEDVEVGELVQTLNGFKEVTSCWNPETLIQGTPECYEIEFEDGHKVTCSANHQFLVNGQWTEAKALVEGNDVETV